MSNQKDYSNMLVVHTDTKGLQYDINAIEKAFFPSYDVRIIEPDEPVHDQAILELPTFMSVILQFEDKKQGIVYISELDDNGNPVGRFELPEPECNEEIKRYVFDIDEELGAKKSFKLFLYDVMVTLTGRTLPWGNLTGVRPTKIATTMIEQGKTDSEIRDFMQSVHRVSDEKTLLALDIAHTESNLMKKLDYTNGYSLYIGIPFCPTTCLYCSFTSYPISAWQKRVDEYLDALGRELDYVSNEFAEGRDGNASKHPDTVYIGGGTPTSLDEYHLEKLLDKITSTIDISGCLEFTCEAGRPDSITPEKLAIMKKYGVSRISVNPQTMQQRTLDLIGRRVKTEQIIDSFYAARGAGHDNINMDIILGLPGEDECDVRDTMEKISQMKPDSLTVHSLAIKRASALKKRLDEIGIDALRNTDETMKIASDAALTMGMKPYYMYRQKNMSGNFENTGFSVPGKEGLYNILIMEEVQTIIACGAGTVTKRVYGDGRIERCDNVKDVGLYIEKIDEMIERKRRLFEDEK